MKPVEYTQSVQGFGTWRIAYVPEAKTWRLAYNARPRGVQWTPARDFAVPESAAIAIGERKTGVHGWDHLRFAAGRISELSTWSTEASDGGQEDAAD